MNKHDKFEHWADIARYDLDTAEAMLKSGRYLYVTFMCQQAIEKLVKGLYVWHLDQEPPRTHNIYLIYQAIFEKDDQGKKEEALYAPFFAELLAYYISERYPSYREKLSTIVSKDKAEEVLQKSKGGVRVAPIPQNIADVLQSFVNKIGKQIPIKKAILFGSYARGNSNSGSDVDLAVFSDYFEGKTRVEGITFLLMNAMEYKIDLEPVAFTDKEYEEQLGIVAEIINTGIEIPIQE